MLPIALSLLTSFPLPAAGNPLLVSTADFDLITSPDDLIVLGFGAEDVPIEIGRLTGIAGATALAADREIALVALPADSLLVVGLASSTAPEVLGGLRVDQDAGAIASAALQGDRGFLLTEGGRLDILGLSDPTDPTLLGSWETEADTYSGGFVAAGEAGAAYLALRDPEGINHLDVIDAADPVEPELVTRLELGWNWFEEASISGIARTGTTLLTPYNDSPMSACGFAAWDLRDPLWPELRWSWDTGADTESIQAIGLTIADSLAVFLQHQPMRNTTSLTRRWLSDREYISIPVSTALGALAISAAPGRLAVLADRFPARLLRYHNPPPNPVARRRRWL